MQKYLILISEGFLVNLKHGGGGLNQLAGLVDLIANAYIFHPNQPNMVSNESWPLYLGTDSL